jgi:hypothetical protein
MLTIFGTPEAALPRKAGTRIASSRLMKAMVATTALTILLLVGATQLPPGDVAGALQNLCAPLNPGRRASNERTVMTTLKMLASAQADFRANDRDQDGVKQFWRGDVAGLYALSPNGGSAIKLIPLDVAASDDSPLIPALPGARWKASNGYRIRAIRSADEDPKKLDPDRFAFVAYPASPSAGKYVYIINENNSLFRSAYPYGVIDAFPTDMELKMYWSHAG